MVEIDWIHTPIDLNRTACIPTEKVLEMLPHIVLKKDALMLAEICLFVGFGIGIIGAYLWIRQGRRDIDGSS